MRAPKVGELHIILLFVVVVRALCTLVFGYSSLGSASEDADLYVRWLGQILMFSLLFAIPAYLYGLRGPRLSGIIGPPQQSARVAAACICGLLLYGFAVGQHAAETLAIAQFNPQAAFYQWPYHPGITDPVWSPFDLAVVFLIATTLGPFAEEFFFRALLVDALRRKYGKHMAALYSSCLFILLHYQHPHIVSTLVFGLGLAYLYMHTRSLTLCVAVHSSYNLIAWIRSNMGLEAQARPLESLHLAGSWTAELIVWMAAGMLIAYGSYRFRHIVFAPERATMDNEAYDTAK